jgi:Resolvase, N terminal domain
LPPAARDYKIHFHGSGQADTAAEQASPEVHPLVVFEQTADNQLIELRRYVEARGWTAVEFVDHGVSGLKDRRPALDALLKDAKRRRFDISST